MDQLEQLLKIRISVPYAGSAESVTLDVGVTQGIAEFNKLLR